MAYIQASAASGEHPSEWVVPTGIEQKQCDTRLSIKLIEYEIQIESLEAQIALGVKVCLYRHEPVASGDLHCVTSIEEQCCVRAARALTKSTYGCFKCGAVRIGHSLHVKA